MCSLLQVVTASAHFLHVFEFHQIWFWTFVLLLLLNFIFNVRKCSVLQKSWKTELYILGKLLTYRTKLFFHIFKINMAAILVCILSALNLCRNTGFLFINVRGNSLTSTLGESLFLNTGCPHTCLKCQSVNTMFIFDYFANGEGGGSLQGEIKIRNKSRARLFWYQISSFTRRCIYTVGTVWISV